MRRLLPKSPLNRALAYPALTMFVLLLTSQSTRITLAQPAPISSSDLHAQFLNPPDDARIMMRWWWFGPAATKPEITRELEQMKSAGIGGVEIANLYPLALDDPKTGFHNTPFLSDEHLAALRFANQEAHRLGLRIDITLGSGWPFGGPHIPVTEAAGKLRVERIPVPPNTTEIKAPFIDSGEELISAFLQPSATEKSENTKPLPSPEAGWYHFPSAVQQRTMICFISSRTGMMVKRPSIGAAGFVLDHYDKTATETHLKAVGDRLLSAFGDQPPYAIFSDSLEVYASDWTPNLLGEFQRRRGYDLRPHLLALVEDAGPETEAIRHDWGRTLTELADENFLAPMHDWAQTNHTLFRAQNYGFPPVTLYSNRFADLPEGEGKATRFMAREFSDTRWAASAGHLFHHPVISSETWTWLHSPAFRATPLDMKAEADLHFLQGINQLVGHGWPYSPETAPEPGWRMYAAASFDAHNPWFHVMPDVTRYLQRVSFALRQGEPANDVALLLPNDDIWATFTASFAHRASPTSAAGFDESGSNVTIDERTGERLGTHIIAQILDAGYNLDFIDADSIDNLGIPYKALVLPNIDRLPVATYQKILAFAQRGGTVIATGHMPSTAQGFLHATESSAQLRQISEQLFHGTIATAHSIPSENTLGATLTLDIPPDMKLSPATPEIGFIHRHLKDSDLYFVANTSNETKKATAHFRAAASHAELWDATTGIVSGVSDPNAIQLDLAPYESRLVYFSNSGSPLSLPKAQHPINTIDLSTDWQVHFADLDSPIQMNQLRSWTDNPRTRYFSGHAEYTRTFTVNSLPASSTFNLDFGPGIPETLPKPGAPHSMRAYLISPIREAAQVFVNDKLAGSLWHPPYRLDLTPYLHTGSNDLRIVVGNTAINTLAGQSLPDYRLLWDRYGMLFVPQDMENLQPLPSGILGPIKLIESAPTK